MGILSHQRSYSPSLFVILILHCFETVVVYMISGLMRTIRNQIPILCIVQYRRLPQQTHTSRHTNIQTYRHTDIRTYRHTDIIQTYRHTIITIEFISWRTGEPLERKPWFWWHSHIYRIQTCNPRRTWAFKEKACDPKSNWRKKDICFDGMYCRYCVYVLYFTSCQIYWCVSISVNVIVSRL